MAYYSFHTPYNKQHSSYEKRHAIKTSKSCMRLTCRALLDFFHLNGMVYGRSRAGYPPPWERLRCDQRIEICYRHLGSTESHSQYSHYLIEEISSVILSV